MRAGFNVGEMADNLGESIHVEIPGISHVTDWTFNKLARGAMLQSGLAMLERNLKRFPERSRAENVRQTAREGNEMFGNLGTQGPIKSQTMQDVSKLAFLAPNWTISQLLTQLRAMGEYGQQNLPLPRNPLVWPHGAGRVPQRGRGGGSRQPRCRQRTAAWCFRVREAMTPFDRHLQAAEGFLELGLPLDAHEEIELIEPEMRTLSEVLAVRVGIFQKLERWGLMEVVAGQLCKQHPELIPVLSL